MFSFLLDHNNESLPVLASLITTLASRQPREHKGQCCPGGRRLQLSRRMFWSGPWPDCQQSVQSILLVIRVQHCRSPCSRCHPRGGRASRARSRVTAEFTDFPSTAPEIQWSGTMTGAKYFKIEQKKKKSLTNICSCSEFLNNFKWSEDVNTTEHTIVLLYKCSWILNRNCPIWLTKN